MYMYRSNSMSFRGPSWSWSYGSWIHNYLCNQCLSSLTLWVWIPLKWGVLKTYIKVCQWLATGQWFSPDTPEILLKVALNTIPPLFNEFCSFWEDIQNFNKRFLKIYLVVWWQCWISNYCKNWLKPFKILSRKICFQMYPWFQKRFFKTFSYKVFFFNTITNVYRTMSTGHSTAAGHWANCPSNCISHWLLCFQKWKCQSESKIQLCFANWFSRIASRMGLLQFMFFHSYSFKNDFFTFSHRDLYQTYMSCSGI